MNFKDQLVDSGRIIGEMVTAKVGNNPEYYLQILDMVLYEKMPMQSRAGRVLFLSTEKYPYLFSPYINKVLQHAREHNYVHRSLLAVFAELNIDLTEEQEGILLDLCFSWLSDQQLEVAHIIYCFTILFRIVKKYPELIPELEMTIKNIISHGSAGVKNRGKRILTELKKIETK